MRSRKNPLCVGSRAPRDDRFPLRSLVPHARQVDELRGVLRARQEAQRRAVEAHRLAAAGMALQSALESGSPFRAELAGLVEAAKGDSLVEAAAAPLRPLAEKGVVPREQLQGLLHDGVADEARRAALVPAGAGGVLSYALARAAAVLRVLEPSPEHAGKGMKGARAGGLPLPAARCRMV